MFTQLPLRNWNGITGLLAKAPQPEDPAVAPVAKGAFQNTFNNNGFNYVIGTGGDSPGVIGITLSIYDSAGVATQPFLFGYLTTGSVAWTTGPSFLNGGYNLAVNGRYLYIASSGSSVFYVVDVQDPSTPTNVGRLLISGTPGSLYSVVYLAGHCFIATQNTGLVVVDVTNPLLPLQKFQEGGAVKSFGVRLSTDNKTLFTTQFSTTSPFALRQIKSWDIRNPLVPVLLQSLQVHTLGEALGLSVNKNTAFVTVITTGVYSVNLIDITNPSSMSNLSQITPLNSFDSGVFAIPDLGTNYLYVPSGSNSTYGGSVETYDISNRSAPSRLSTLASGTPTSVFGGGSLSNGFLYIADYGISTAESSFFDVFTTPYKPILMGSPL